MPSALVLEALEAQKKRYGSTVPAYYRPLPASRINKNNDVSLDKIFAADDDDEHWYACDCNRERLKKIGHWVILSSLVIMTIYVLLSSTNAKLPSLPFHAITISHSKSKSSKSSASSDSSAFTLTSTAFVANGTMADKYSCKFGTETGVSPPLAWNNPPPDTEDFMITMKKESGYSWTVYDLGSLDHVDEGTSNAATSGASTMLACCHAGMLALATCKFLLSMQTHLSRPYKRRLLPSFSIVSYPNNVNPVPYTLIPPR